MSIVGYCCTEHVVFLQAVQFVNIAEKFVMFHATTGHVNSPINLRDRSEFINSPECSLQEVISHFACRGGKGIQAERFLLLNNFETRLKRIFLREDLFCIKQVSKVSKNLKDNS